jgi:hypothetical protein
MKAGDKNKAELLQILRSIFCEVETEYRFHQVRKWRFDYAIPSRKIAVEYQGHGGMGGGSGHMGRHSSITGLAGDCEKFNEARLYGWTVITFTALHFREGDRVKHKLSSPLATLSRLAALTA